MLGSFPERFLPNVVLFENCRNVEEMDLDELIGSLQTYELTLKRRKKKKPGTCPALKHSIEPCITANVDFEILEIISL